MMKNKYKRKRNVRKYSGFHHRVKIISPIHKKVVSEPSIEEVMREFLTPAGPEEMRDLSQEALPKEDNA